MYHTQPAKLSFDQKTFFVDLTAEESFFFTFSNVDYVLVLLIARYVPGIVYGSKTQQKHRQKTIRGRPSRSPISQFARGTHS